MTESQTAAGQAEDLARAEETLGERLVDPDSPAPRLAVPEQPKTSELAENARRAILKRIAEMADGDATGIENVADALRAVEYL
jgi:hypothetical protein